MKLAERLRELSTRMIVRDQDWVDLRATLAEAADLADILAPILPRLADLCGRYFEHGLGDGLSGAFADVLAFHRRLNPAIVAPLPHVPDGGAECHYGLGFVVEEVAELEDAMLKGDLALVADALVDLIYVTIRAGLIWGIDLRPVWTAVHEANMRKEGGQTRPDGKVLKPPGWRPAPVAAILVDQRPIDV